MCLCVCVHVCLSVCVCRLLQLHKDQRSVSKSLYRLLVMFSWILIRGFANNASFSLLGMPLQPFQKST